MTEQLQEGWVKFIRIHCKEGWLDRWMGDCINSPNNESMSNFQLNAMSTYWRCGGKWVSASEIDNTKINELLDVRNELTAQEIWDKLNNK